MTPTPETAGKETLVEHTPTPWTYRPWRHDDWGWIRGPAAPGEEFGQLVALARCDGDYDPNEHRSNGTDPHAANAAFIVEAVNSYDRLRIQLAKAVEALEEIAVLQTCSRSQRIARSTLLQIKGEKR